MRALLAAAAIDIELLEGAEVALDEAAQLDDETLTALRLGGGSHLLVESPYETMGPALERTVAALSARGHGVLLAHPERCPAFLDRPQRLHALVERGALCSVTAGALAGSFGQGSQWFALELVRDGFAHSVDSDAHAVPGRPPGLEDGLAAAAEVLPGFEPLGRWLATDAPAAILAGEPLPPRPARTGR
jgi:protein-tyrosine phosphatase